MSKQNCQLLTSTLFFYQGKTPGGSKITEVEYIIRLVVNPTLAGRRQ